MSWTLTDALKATGGRLIQGTVDTPLAGFSTDTRNMEPGTCFLALLGENHDGHVHVADALTKGATSAIVQADRVHSIGRLPAHAAIIEVPDTLEALGELARFHRNRFRIPLAGITGSNGKTSTKEMVAAILSRRSRVLKNSGNFNNLIGVPLTLLCLQPEHQMAVVEMGINVPGEMARLVAMSRPTVGLITNIHPAHLEGLGSVEGIVEEKGRLWTEMDADGVAVINLDDERLRRFPLPSRRRAVTCSLRDASADVALAASVETEGAMSVFQLRLGTAVVPVRLSVLGEHHVMNGVAAAAVAWSMGEPPEVIAEGLSAHRPVKQRMEVTHLKNGRVLVDDTYNANPRSMLAAVRAVCGASGGSRVIMVLGDMKELGPESPALHREVGRQIGLLGVGEIITLGEMSREIGTGAQEAGLSPKACRHAGSHEEAAAWVMEKRPAGEWILVKGSRSMAMEKVVARLVGGEEREAGQRA